MNAESGQAFLGIGQFRKGWVGLLPVFEAIIRASVLFDQGKSCLWASGFPRLIIYFSYNLPFLLALLPL